MAEFDVNSHLSDGKSLQWLALPAKGEKPSDVEAKVRWAAGEKFGPAIFLKQWNHTVASNGYITVRMLA